MVDKMIFMELVLPRCGLSKRETIFFISGLIGWDIVNFPTNSMMKSRACIELFA